MGNWITISTAGAPGGTVGVTLPYTIDSAVGYYDVDAGVLTVEVSVTPGAGTNDAKGGHVYLEVPDASASAGGVASYSLAASALGHTGTRPLRGAWKPIDAGVYTYEADQQPWIVKISVKTATLHSGGSATNVRVYVSAFSLTQNLPLVRVGETGETPSAVCTVIPGVAKPGAGNANAPNVGSVVATVLANDNHTGKLLTPIAVVVSGLPDPLPPGWGYEVCLTWDENVPDYTDPNLGQVATGIFSNAGLVPAGPDGVEVGHTLALDTPTTVKPGAVWIRALIKDAQGNIRRNALVPGVTPCAPIVVGITDNSGTMDPRQFKNQGSEFHWDAARGKWALNASNEFKVDPDTGKWVMDKIDLLKAINASAEFHVDPDTGKWSVNKVALFTPTMGGEFNVDGTTGAISIKTVDMSKASNLSTQFTKVGSTQTITSLAADLLLTGRLQVGGGKVSLAKFFDTQSTPGLIGFVGDDTTTASNPNGTGYVGAWWKRMGIGGSGPTTPNFFADSNGYVICKSVQIADASGTAGYINDSGSWFKRVGIGGTSGSPNFFADSNGYVALASVYIGDTGGSYGVISATGSWFKSLAVGGTSWSSPKLRADSTGKLDILDATFSLQRSETGGESYLVQIRDAWTIPGLSSVSFTGLQIARVSNTNHKAMLINRGLLCLNPDNKVVAAFTSYNNEPSGGNGGSFYGSCWLANASGNQTIILDGGLSGYGKLSVGDSSGNATVLLDGSTGSVYLTSGSGSVGFYVNGTKLTTGGGVAVCYSFSTPTLAASIGVNNLTYAGGTPPAGLYRVNMALTTAGTGTGNATLIVNWNDGAGAKTGNIICLFAQIGGTPSVFNSLLLYTSGGTMTWQVNYTSTGSYGVAITMEKQS